MRDLLGDPPPRVTEASPIAWLACLRDWAQPAGVKVHRSDNYMFFCRQIDSATMSWLANGNVVVERGISFTGDISASGVSIDLTRDSYHNIIIQLADTMPPSRSQRQYNWMETRALFDSILSARRIWVPDPDVGMLRAVLKTLTAQNLPPPSQRLETLLKRLRIEMARSLRAGDTMGIIAAAALLESQFRF